MAAAGSMAAQRMAMTTRAWLVGCVVRVRVWAEGILGRHLPSSCVMYNIVRQMLRQRCRRLGRPSHVGQTRISSPIYFPPKPRLCPKTLLHAAGTTSHRIIDGGAAAPPRRAATGPPVPSRIRNPRLLSSSVSLFLFVFGIVISYLFGVDYSLEEGCVLAGE
jgi:hypothetical protein